MRVLASTSITTAARDEDGLGALIEARASQKISATLAPHRVNRVFTRIMPVSATMAMPMRFERS